MADDDDALNPPAPPAPPPPPPSPEEALRRREFLGRPDVQDALLESLSRCAEINRMGILNEGCADALEDLEFPLGEEESLEFALRKVKNAKERFYYAIRKRNTKEQSHAGYENLGPLDGPPPGLLEQAGDVAEELAATDATHARTLGIMKAQYLERETLGDAAARYGMNEEAAAKAKRRFTLAVRAAMGIVAAFLLFLILRPAPSPNEPVTEDVPEPTPTATVREPTPHELAVRMTESALDECAHALWHSCVQALDDAARLDPTVAQQADVQAARAKATAAIAAQEAEEKAREKGPKGP